MIFSYVASQTEIPLVFFVICPLLACAQSYVACHFGSNPKLHIVHSVDTFGSFNHSLSTIDILLKELELTIKQNRNKIGD